MKIWDCPRVTDSENQPAWLTSCTAVFTPRTSAHFSYLQAKAGCGKNASSRCRILSLLVLKSSLNLLSLVTYSSRRSTDEKWRATCPVAPVLDQSNQIWSYSWLWFVVLVSVSHLLALCCFPVSLQAYLPRQSVSQDSDLPILAISSILQTEC